MPPSCCIPEYSSNGQCGFGVRRKPGQNYTKIYEDGCLKKGEAWLKYHILPVSISIGVLGLLQVIKKSLNFYEKYEYELIKFFYFFSFWVFVLHKACVVTYCCKSRNGIEVIDKL